MLRDTLALSIEESRLGAQVVERLDVERARIDQGGRCEGL